MKLSEYAMIGLFVVVVAGMAWGWRQEGIKTALAEQEANNLRAELADSSQALDSVRTQFEHDRTQFGHDLRNTQQLLQNARRTILNLRTTGDSLETVLGTLGDSLSDSTLYGTDTSALHGDSVTILRQIADTRLREANECGVALDSTQQMLGACGALLARADTLLDQERGIRRQTEALAETYRKLAHPSLFTRIGKGLPYLGAGIVLGLVLRN